MPSARPCAAKLPLRRVVRHGDPSWPSDFKAASAFWAAARAAASARYVPLLMPFAKPAEKL